MAILGKSKRLIFFRGYQKKFILGFLNNLHINNQTAADILKVSVRTFSDWKREKYSLPVEAAQKITASCKIRPQKVKGTVDLYSHLKLNAQKGGQEMYRIHGRVGGDPKRGGRDGKNGGMK